MNAKQGQLTPCKLPIKLLVFIVIMACFNGRILSQSSEYTIKAVALEKLSLFITWPANAFKNSSTQEFVIGIYGQTAFKDILETVYKDKKIKDRKVKIIAISTLQEFKDCHLLYIPNINLSNLNKVLNYVEGKPILTISDSEGFAEAGCFINFYEYENKLRFEINQKRMKEAGFTIDYRLLKVSKIINPVLE
jgi:hypothetical protein